MEFLDDMDWGVYDPDYPIDGGRHNDDEHKPVGHDDWADEDLEGGF